MRTLKLSTVAAVSALGTVVCFVAGSVAMGVSGVGNLIPETGGPGRDWIAAVDRPSGLFVSAWLVVLVGFLGIVALVGFLRDPSIGWARNDSGADSRRRRIDPGDSLAPNPDRDGLRARALAFIAAGKAGQATLAATADTFAAIALVTPLPAIFSAGAWSFRFTRWPSSPRACCKNLRSFHDHWHYKMIIGTT